MLRSLVTPGVAAAGRLQSETLVRALPSGLDQVRYKRVRMRKPRWMPRAPSKLFTLFNKRVSDPEEEHQYRVLEDRYKTELRSIRAFFKTEQARIDHEMSEFSKSSIDEENLFQKRLEANEAENRRVGAEREMKHEEDLLRRLEEKRVAVEKMRKNANEAIEAAKVVLQQEIAASSSFITLETLDQAIDKALQEPTSYCFALTPSGKTIPWKAGHQGEKSPPKEVAEIEASYGSS